MSEDRIITKGTDVRFRFKLGELNKFDVTSVKQMRCYLIRHEDKDFTEKVHNCNFPQFYHPTEYTMSPNIYGNQIFTYYNPYFSSNAMFGKVSDYHMFPSYNGFGVYSKRFVNTHTDYLCASRLLPEKNMAECYFPAEDQMFTGVFDLIIMVTLYQRGWGEDNLRTYTIRKNEALELIEGPSYVDGNIDLDKEEPTLEQVELGDFMFDMTDVIQFGDKDLSGKKFVIKLHYSDGSVKLYNGQDGIKISVDTLGVEYDETNMCIRINDTSQDTIFRVIIQVNLVDIINTVQLKRRRNIVLNAKDKFEMDGPTSVKYGTSGEFTVRPVESGSEERFNLNVYEEGVDITSRLTLHWGGMNNQYVQFTIPNITKDIVIEASV